MENKYCPNCKLNKYVIEFFKCSSRKDGLQCYCKDCKKGRFKESKQKSDKKYSKKYYSIKENKIKKNKYSKEYQKQNPKIQKEYHNKFRNSEKGKIYNRKYKKEEYKKKYGIDIQWTLKIILRNRLKNAVQKEFKKGKTLDFLGCSIEEFKLYLERQFDEDMSWNNYGKFKYWEIDHIKPCDAFDLTKESEQRECFHFSNLRPYSIIKNRQKSNKYE